MTAQNLQQANLLDATIKRLKAALEKTKVIEKALNAPDFHFKFYYKTRDTFSNVGDFTPNKSAFLSYLKTEQFYLESQIETLEKQLSEL
jgi:hypothetical protein